MQLELVPTGMGVLARTSIRYDRVNHACTALPILDIKTYLHDLLCLAHNFLSNSISISLFAHVLLSHQLTYSGNTFSWTLPIVVENLVAPTDMDRPLLTNFPATWTLNNMVSIGYRYDEVRIVPLTYERLAIHNLVHGRTAWIIRSTCDPSTLWTTCMTSSASIETMPTETTEATRGNWIRAELRGCHCGCCEPHWFQYGWECGE